MGGSMTTVFTSSREFRVWSYKVGHRELLIRSTRNDDYQTRVDLFFVSVYEMNLLTTLRGPTIVAIDSSLALKGESPRTRFRISGHGYECQVVAGAFGFHED